MCTCIFVLKRILQSIHTFLKPIFKSGTDYHARKYLVKRTWSLGRLKTERPGFQTWSLSLKRSANWSA